MLMVAHPDERGSTARPAGDALDGLLTALDEDELWRACIAMLTARLACHSCSLLFDIIGLHPRRGLHHLAAPTSPAVLATSLTVAAPFLQRHPRVPLYTFSQMAAQDSRADARLRAQDPSPRWRDFIHMAFWHHSTLEAVLSVRLSGAMAAADELRFLAELHPLLDAAFRRIRRLRAERRRLRTLEAQLQAMSALPGEPASRLPTGAEPLRRPCGSERMPATDARHRRRTALAMARVDADALTAAADAGSRTLAASALLLRLSPSERKVAAMVGHGMRNAAIAERLCRSPKTIEHQISSIYRKLDIENRTQLARLLA